MSHYDEYRRKYPWRMRWERWKLCVSVWWYRRRHRERLEYQDRLIRQCRRAEAKLDGRAATIRRLVERVETLKDALRAIVRHQETIGGGLAVLSSTRRIAQAALDAAERSG